jgi:exopolyphosphatase/guanosine-5'-triphosphate,3'-diphosphate pyrophosphatase
MFNEKAVPGLGKGLERSGRLNAEGRKSALVNINRFIALTRAMGVTDIELLATAAVRDATDGKEFAREIERMTGCKVKVISGEEEARLSALGVISGIQDADGLMGDLGGGSLELVAIDGGRIVEQATIPIGPLRLLEAVEGDMNQAQKIVDRHLESLPWLLRARGRSFYPVGGTWRTLARVHMEQTRYPLHIIHEYRVPRRAAEDIARVVSRLGKRSLASTPGVSRRRTETLPVGALILERVLRFSRPDNVVFSAYGLREGYMFNRLDSGEQAEDPLLVGSQEFAGIDGRFGAVSASLNEWIAPLFAGDPKPRQRLREAACALSDIGWREHPDYRAEHAFFRVLRLPVAGLDHEDRVTLALAVAARYGADVDSHFSEAMLPLVREEDLEFAARLGATIRLAYSISGGTLAMLDDANLYREQGRIHLHLPADSRDLFGEAVQRRLEAVGRAFRQEAIIV